MAKKKKKKRLSKYEKTVIREREAFRASKQPLVEKTHKLWKANPSLAPVGWELDLEYKATVIYDDGSEEIVEGEL